MMLKHTQSFKDQFSEWQAFKSKCPALKTFDTLVGFPETQTEAEQESDPLLDDVLPPSCTYGRYISGQGCGLGMKITSLDIEIEATVSKCPSSPVPFVKVQCRGDGCIDVGKICN